MEYEIFSIGDPAFLAETLKATTTILNRDGLGGIVAIGFLFTFIWTIVQGVLSGGKEIKIQNIVMAGLIYAAFFGVKVDRVNVWSLYGMELHQVEDVPLGLAFSGTVISKIGNEITEWFEQEYTVIGMTTSELGTGFALKALYEMRGLGFSDGSLKWDPNGHLTKTLDNYVRNCVVPATTVGTRDTEDNYNGLPAINLKNVFEKESAWEHLDWDNRVYSTLVYPYISSDPTPDNTTQVLPCAEAYDYITDKWINNPAVIDMWMGNIGESVCNEAGHSCETFKTSSGQFDKTSFTNQFNVIRNSIMTTDVALDKLMLNRALLLPLSNLSAQEIGTGDALVSAVTSRASAQITSNQALQQTMFEKMMLPLMTFFEALMYVAAPFAAILVAFGLGGIQMIGKYLVFALWIQLWKPVAAVGNMFIQMSVSGEMSNLNGFAMAKGDSLASLSNQPEVFDSLQHWIGVGGMLVASTPAITLMLMYGSAVTASSLAGRIDMGKGAEVGMDGFSGKSQVGDAKASLTKEGGNIAMGNDQTADATQGAVSMGATMKNEAQQAESVARSETKKAEEARGQALQSVTSAGTGISQRQATIETAGGDSVSSQQYSDTFSQKLVEQHGLSDTQASRVTAGVNAKASAGADFGRLMRKLQDNKVDTSNVKGAGHLGMIMQALDGKVGGGADYQDQFNEAAQETEQLSNIVDESWQATESDRTSITQGWKGSDEDSISQSKEWKDSETQSQTYQESTARARSAEQRASTLKSLAGTSGYSQQFQLATLSADAAGRGGMSEFGQFLEAKSNQGDSSYAGMEANVGDYRKALRTAVSEGNTGDMAELMSIAGHNVEDPSPDVGVGALSQELMTHAGGPPQADGSGLHSLNDLSQDGKMTLNSLDAGNREGAAEDWLNDHPEVDPDNLTKEQGMQYLQDTGQLEEGEMNGVTKDGDQVAQDNDQAMNDSELGRTGGKGKALMDFLDTGMIQQAAERSGDGTQAGAAVGGAAGAVMSAQAAKAAGKSVAMGMIRGASSGVFRGGAWGSVAGAAYGAAEGYADYQSTVDQEKKDQAGKELKNAQGNGDFSQITNASQEVINSTLEGVIAKQVVAMDQAAAQGEEFDAQEFRNNELDTFEQQVFDQGDSLLSSGQGYADGLGMSMASAVDDGLDRRQAASAMAEETNDRLPSFGSF